MAANPFATRVGSPEADTRLVYLLAGHVDDAVDHLRPAAAQNLSWTIDHVRAELHLRRGLEFKGTARRLRRVRQGPGSLGPRQAAQRDRQRGPRAEQGSGLRPINARVGRTRGRDVPHFGMLPPHTPAVPPPPHVWGAEQVPQSSWLPQPSPAGPQLKPSPTHVTGTHDEPQTPA